jgi:predicted ArsR family transcriptional regulator
MTRWIEFPKLEQPYFEFEVDYSYYYDGGKLTGRPEDCYPPEEDGEVWIVDKFWKEKVRQEYAKLAEQAIKEIENEVYLLNPKEWVYEDKASY